MAAIALCSGGEHFAASVCHELCWLAVFGSRPVTRRSTPAPTAAHKPQQKRGISHTLASSECSGTAVLAVATAAASDFKGPQMVLVVVVVAVAVAVVAAMNGSAARSSNAGMVIGGKRLPKTCILDVNCVRSAVCLLYR